MYTCIWQQFLTTKYTSKKNNRKQKLYKVFRKIYIFLNSQQYFLDIDKYLFFNARIRRTYNMIQYVILTVDYF